MNKLITKIFATELSVAIHMLIPIKGYGSVNEIFEVKSNMGNFIIRLNGLDKWLEYQKEAWYLEATRRLGIPGPKILKICIMDKRVYMIQTKIQGRNGRDCGNDAQNQIWFTLGRYASTFSSIPCIQQKDVNKSLFHRDWRHRLRYNLNELNKNDRLLSDEVFSTSEQNTAKTVLKSLELKDFKSGLVHGDLCPRNVMVEQDEIYLLDWGTAEINVVPHIEIVTILMSTEASVAAFELYIAGLGLPIKAYQSIETEVKLLRFLHHLDKYRWAEGQSGIQLEDYATKVRHTFEQI